MATLVPQLSSVNVQPTADTAECIHQAVRKQAIRRPNAIAVTAGDQVMTYRDLESCANRLARQLRAAGVGADVPVGLCLPRGLEMVVGALGILKSGGAYVPMDPAYPAERLLFTLEDACAPVLVSNSAMARRLSSANCEFIILDALEAFAEPDDPPESRSNPSDLAYIVYTSGSTGTPKGVEITHAGLSNLAAWHGKAFAVTPQDRASHLAGLSFDAAVWELWPYLAAGASLHLADDGTRSSPDLLRDWMLERAVTIGFAPTPIAERLVLLEWPGNTPLRILLTGGEALRRRPPAGLPFQLVNNYGPSECTVVATSCVVSADGPSGGHPPIGKAIANLHTYVLDEQLEPVAAGCLGELYIGGAGVARGYRRRPALTESRFLRDPFRREADARMYRTGDLVCLRSDGLLEFHGRIDDQVKIRGYRIEPNEIVTLLDRHPAIRQSVVIAREDEPGDKRLVGYIVLRRETAATAAELREFLRHSVPEYMIPAVFVKLDTLPLTPNGKTDRAALPVPDANNIVTDAPAADDSTTDLQCRIAAIGAALLERESISIHDNFFLMGGHSLLGAQLIANLRAAFGVEVSLRMLFAAPTVAGMAEEIDRLLRNGTAPAQVRQTSNL